MKKAFIFMSWLVLVGLFTGNAWGSIIDARWAYPKAFDLNLLSDPLWAKVSPGEPFVSVNKHNLNDHADFNPATQIITSATLDLYMRDTVLLDQDDPLWYPYHDFETAILFVEGIQCSEKYEVDNDTTGTYNLLGWNKYTYTLTPEMIAKLVENNFILDFTLTADPSQGDFLFKKSILRVETAPVPVPATIFLLGSGLLGLTGIRRRKAS